MELIRTFKEFNKNESPAEKARSAVRELAIFALSQRSSITASGNWIRFPYYHHVFDDERKDFERQLKYLRNFGEFISIDDVCDMMNDKAAIDGRYFCVSFDDGYRCLHDNMMPITAEMNIPVIIYLPTIYTGLSETNEEDIVLIKNNLPGNPKLLSFLNWAQCREMLDHKISFGSHTKTHANLAGLSPAQIENELLESKLIIEESLQQSCRHFACPWGRVNINFDPAITTPIAQRLGYQTFCTTDRGKTQKGDDLFLLKRDHLLAGWGNYQLKYFFSK